MQVKKRRRRRKRREIDEEVQESVTRKDGKKYEVEKKGGEWKMEVMMGNKERRKDEWVDRWMVG